MNQMIKSQTIKGMLAKACFFFAIVVSFSACKEQEFRNPYMQTDEQREAQKKIDEQVIRKYFRDNNVDTTKVVRTSSGLYHLTVTEGTGNLVKANQQVAVHYIGKNIFNQTFDSSYPRGNSFSFVVGTRQVIQGWDEGLQLMKVGERANLYIPSYLAYGFMGSSSIPPNSVLIFEIDVLSAK